MADEKQSFFVESPDGRKFKMVIRGDLGRLSVGKIRRYLGNYGVEDGCRLSFNGINLENDMMGEDFGLETNAVIKIEDDARHEVEDQEREPTRQRSQQQQQQQQQSRAAAGGAAPLRPHDAWGQQQGLPGAAAAAVGNVKSPNTTRDAAHDDLRAQLARLEEEKAALERKVRALSAPSPTGTKKASGDPFEKARENLRVLSEDLGLPLQFDANGTCVLNGEDSGRAGRGVDAGEGLSIFISYDAQTKRVVLYTTLLTQLPLDNPALLAKLYEILLEGSLLGREVCGGGVGIARDTELVVVQTSFSAIHCDATLLRDTMPLFVETVRRWRGLINDLMA